MSKRHLPLFLISLFLLSSLACNLSIWDNAVRPTRAPEHSYLTGLTAEVFSGSNVHVRIPYIRGWETEATLSCAYPNGKNGSNQYAKTLENLDEPTSVTSFDFVLAVPGTYQVNCSLSGSQKSASFTILEPTATKAAAAGPNQAVPTSKAFSITGTGTLTKIYADPPGTCTVKASQVVVQGHENDTARLEIYYPVITTFGPPCTTSGDTIGYNLGEGIINRADETITYTSCINGLYKAQGQISYSGKTLKGEVTCFDTGAGLSTSVKIVMP